MQENNILKETLTFFFVWVEVWNNFLHLNKRDFFVLRVSIIGALKISSFIIDFHMQCNCIKCLNEQNFDYNIVFYGVPNSLRVKSFNPFIQCHIAIIFEFILKAAVA